MCMPFCVCVSVCFVACFVLQGFCSLNVLQGVLGINAYRPSLCDFFFFLLSVQKQLDLNKKKVNDTLYFSTCCHVTDAHSKPVFKQTSKEQCIIVNCKEKDTLFSTMFTDVGLKTMRELVLVSLPAQRPTRCSYSLRNTETPAQIGQRQTMSTVFQVLPWTFSWIYIWALTGPLQHTNGPDRNIVDVQGPGR